MDLPADPFPPWNRWLAGGRLDSPVRVVAVVLRASCWGLRGHPYWDLDRTWLDRDHLVASSPAAGDPNWVASSEVDSPREPSPVALAGPGGAAFRDAAAVAIVVAVPNVDPSADAAYAVVAVREALLDHRGLAYDAAAEVPAVLRDLAVEGRSYAEDHAAEAVVHGDSVAAVRAVAGDPAFAYGHLDRPVGGLVDHAGAADLAPEPYAEDPEAVPVVVDTGYAARGTVRDSAKVVPLGLVLEAGA